MQMVILASTLQWVGFRLWKNALMQTKSVPIFCTQRLSWVVFLGATFAILKSNPLFMASALLLKWHTHDKKCNNRNYFGHFLWWWMGSPVSAMISKNQFICYWWRNISILRAKILRFPSRNVTNRPINPIKHWDTRLRPHLRDSLRGLVGFCTVSLASFVWEKCCAYPRI